MEEAAERLAQGGGRKGEGAERETRRVGRVRRRPANLQPWSPSHTPHVRRSQGPGNRCHGPERQDPQLETQREW